MGILQFRRGTATEATSLDLILAAGEPGYETDTHRWKVGDGVTAWTALPYMGGSGVLPVTALGNGGTLEHTGNNTRTSVYSTTIPGGALGPNGALELWLGARISSAPAGTWLVEVELGGDVVAQWQSGDQYQPLKHLIVQNQDDAAAQVAQTELSVGDFTIDTSTNQTLEVFLTINDAGDTGKTVEIFSLVAQTTYGA